MRIRPAHPRHRLHRIGAAASAALLIALVGGWLPAVDAFAQPAANSVNITVLQVTPTTPQASPEPRALTVQLKLTNTTHENLGQVTVQGDRGNPISNQTALDAAIAKTQAPDPTLVGKFTATSPVVTALAAGASTIVTYSSTTANSSAAAGLCLCENRIYPLYFSVLQHTAGGKDVLVGSTQTFIPSFTAGSSPKKVGVSWVWPILERPHRSIRDAVFTDDDLARSVDTGGRLDRVLQVVEQVGAEIPMTLLIDPDLIDELAVMATGKYAVVAGPGHTVPGTGAAPAQDWLLRLRTVLDADPGLQLSFTPYADPDVDSLARSGLDWSTEPSAAALARVRTALGDRSPATDVAWPVNGSLSTQTLGALAVKGVHTLVVDDTTLPGGKHRSPLPDALATVPTDAGKSTLAVTSAAIEGFAGQVVTQGGVGLGRLPDLVSEVAVRAVEDGANAHYVVITPPRDVDPDPDAAAAAIRQTSSTIWSRPLTLQAAVRTVTPVDHGQLAGGRRGHGLPEETIATARFVGQTLPSLTSMIADADERATLFGSLPDGVQRSESSEWSATPSLGSARAQALRNRVDTVTDGVLLVKPTTGTYTLGSADSPLPITIDNTLDATVAVRVQVSAVGGLPGFSADDIGIRTIAPKTRVPLHIPVHIDRAGRISVEVALMTPESVAAERTLLGPPLRLSVRSTALGDIGKIITFVAGAVLAAALLFRVLRRWRRHSNGRSGSPA